MALTRLTHDGYGQLELNAASFRRMGAIEAQCALDGTDFETVPAENGMLLAVDNVTRTVKMPEAENKLPLALNYSTEHMYDERHNALKDFCLRPGEFYPRMGYLQRGDKFTTNTVCFDSEEFSGGEETLLAALGTLTETPLYGVASETGAIKVTKTEAGAPLLVIAKTTMPDGQVAVKFQAR